MDRIYIPEKVIITAQQQLRWATVATIDMGRKEGEGCCAPFAESWDPV